MHTIHTVADIARYASAQSTHSIGLVPTMGALHDGHGSLVRAARANNECVIASIFVNPLQFADNGAGDDYLNYPRQADADAELLESWGVDAVFAPAVEEMYPGFPNLPQITVTTGRMGEIWEGASRPGHFDGVATVITKLFSAIRPTRAYFGRKDAQQLAIISRLVADFNLGVDIIGLPIVRADDGLAESSRNLRLSPSERTHARAISQALFGLADGSFATANQALDFLAASPGITVDYLVTVDPGTLQETTQRPALALAAAWVGPVRLIDNIELA